YSRDVVTGKPGAQRGPGTAPKPYYDSPAFLLQLNIELEGGKYYSVVSDGSWKVTQGPILSDSVYDGEVYDARREAAGWDTPGFDDSGWKPAQIVAGSQGILSAEMMPPIRVVDEIVPMALSNPEPDVYVYDLGQNISGWARFEARGPRGTEVKL